jgi:hypothetical protein
MPTHRARRERYRNRPVAPQKPKPYRAMNDVEKMQFFRAELEVMVKRFKRGTAAESNVLICVRHFVHPMAYHLAQQMMREAALAIGAQVDARGVWKPCHGEVWLVQALAAPQVTVP